jgi:hypothetical protein
MALHMLFYGFAYVIFLINVHIIAYYFAFYACTANNFACYLTYTM